MYKAFEISGVLCAEWGIGNDGRCCNHAVGMGAASASGFIEKKRRHFSHGLCEIDDVITKDALN